MVNFDSYVSLPEGKIQRPSPGVEKLISKTTHNLTPANLGTAPLRSGQHCFPCAKRPRVLVAVFFSVGIFFSEIYLQNGYVHVVIW